MYRHWPCLAPLICFRSLRISVLHDFQPTGSLNHERSPLAALWRDAAWTTKNMNLAIDLVAILMQNAIGTRGQNPISLMTPENTAHSCQNCRWSRVRCDSTRPACRRCAFDGVDCLGYGPPLLWVQPETLHGQHTHGNGSGNGSISRLSRKRGRPKLALAKSRPQPISQRVDMDGSFAIFSTSKDKLVKPPLPCLLPRGLAPANDADVNFTLHCLLYCKWIAGRKLYVAGH